MKTTIYIDGFNLFYGSLKGTSFKWLDLNLLFKNLLAAHHEITSIKYYTANVSPRPGDPDAALRQQIYLKALTAHTPNVEIHLGHFLSNKVTMPRAVPINGEKFVEVIKTEEKGSDVNLAINALNDAWLGRYDCAVIVSNDSDLSEALRIIKQQLKKRIILATPGEAITRPPSFQLKRWAMATIPITNSALSRSQLPTRISGTNLKKPDAWG